MYGAIEMGSGNVLAYMFVGEGKMATYTASCLSFREVGSVAANGGISNRSVGM